MGGGGGGKKKKERKDRQLNRHTNTVIIDEPHISDLRNQHDNKSS